MKTTRQRVFFLYIFLKETLSRRVNLLKIMSEGIGSTRTVFHKCNVVFNRFSFFELVEMSILRS